MRKNNKIHFTLKTAIAGFLFLSIGFFTGFGIVSVHAETSGFVSVLEDMPLMPGLVEDTEAAMVFNSGTSRVIEAAAYGDLTPDKITEFYRHTLPQLGWTSQHSTPLVSRYRRADEVLLLEIIRDPSSASRSWLKFSLSPSKE